MIENIGKASFEVLNNEPLRLLFRIYQVYKGIVACTSKVYGFTMTSLKRRVFTKSNCNLYPVRNNIEFYMYICCICNIQFVNTLSRSSFVPEKWQKRKNILPLFKSMTSAADEK